jgi:hypothetical protein
VAEAEKELDGNKKEQISFLLFLSLRSSFLRLSSDENSVDTQLQTSFSSLSNLGGGGKGNDNKVLSFFSDNFP